MKTILALFCLLPTLCFGQGFGSFKNDQPFLAKDISSVSSETNTLFILYDAGLLGLSDGDPVSVWPDQSYNHFDALQGTASYQPYWTNNASEINDEGYLYFDGVNDYLATNFTDVFQPPYHVFIVTALPDSAGVWETVFSDSSEALNFNVQSGAICFGSGSWLSRVDNQTDWIIWELCSNMQESFIRTNEVVYRYGSLCATNRFSEFRIGGISAPANVKIAYIAFFTNALTDIDAGTFVTNLSTRYGIPSYARDELPNYDLSVNTNVLAVYDLTTNTFNDNIVVTWVSNNIPGFQDLWTTNSPVWRSQPAVKGGRGHIDFNGSTQMMGVEGDTVYPQPTTVVLVATTTGSTADFLLDNGNIPGVNTNQQCVYINGGNTTIDAGTGWNVAFTGLDNYWIYEFEFNGASSIFRTNNVQRATGNAGTNGKKGMAVNGPRTWGLGNVANMNCYWVGVYTNTLDAYSRSNLYYYLGNKFEIPVTLP